MKKADYSKIAEYYDKGRTSSGPVIELWLGLIGKYVNVEEDTHILDIGCGTGRFTLTLVKRFNCRVTGADSSTEMLDKAREKDRDKLVQWDVQDIQKMDYTNDTFDAVFMSNLLHHCESPLKAMMECCRVLKRDGTVLIRYGAREQIREDVTHTFFPETLQIDEARGQSVEDVERLLCEAGFSGIVTAEVEQKSYKSGEEALYVHSVKNTSVLSLISEDSFKYGMEKLTEYVKNHPDDPWLMYDRFSLTTGYKFNI